MVRTPKSNPGRLNVLPVVLIAGAVTIAGIAKQNGLSLHNLFNDNSAKQTTPDNTTPVTTADPEAPPPPPDEILMSEEELADIKIGDVMEVMANGKTYEVQIVGDGENQRLRVNDKFLTAEVNTIGSYWYTAFQNDMSYDDGAFTMDGATLMKETIDVPYFGPKTIQRTFPGSSTLTTQQIIDICKMVERIKQNGKPEEFSYTAYGEPDEEGNKDTFNARLVLSSLPSNVPGTNEIAAQGGE